MIYKKETDLPKNRRRKAQIEKLLDTAMKIVSIDGAEALTMQNLAHRLDFTPGALYRYYSSKDQIIAELQIKCIQEFNNVFELAKNKINESVKNSELRSIVFIVTIGEIFGNFAFEEPLKFGFLTNILVEPKVMVDDINTSKVADEFKNLFLKVSFPFFEAVNKKIMNPGNPAERALIYIASLQGILQLRKLSRIDSGLFDPVLLRKNLTKSLLLGWGVSEENFNKAQEFCLSS